MKLLIFSGTAEGHALCRFLSAYGAQAEAFVATEYGETVMEPLEGITVHSGRLTAQEMADAIPQDALVIDATHPYAKEVSENVRAACMQTGGAYHRLIRPRIAAENAVFVPDTAAAVQWLNGRTGKVLLTTGSKELQAYTAVERFRERLYPRVLPTAQVLSKCEMLGFPGASVIAMQGPFSHEMNLALLRKTDAEILVTKDTGNSGGFAEKCSAAQELGVTVLVIARPDDKEVGLTLREMKAFLMETLGLAESARQREREENRLARFPLFVSLYGRRVLVVGAGKIAARRIDVLQQFGAAVQVVAPEQRAAFAAAYEPRVFCPADLDGAFLAVAATDSRDVNRQIGALCREQGIFVSVADSAAESTFYFPAICQGGGLVAGLVSKGGGQHRAVAGAAERIRALLKEGQDANAENR